MPKKNHYSTGTISRGGCLTEADQDIQELVANLFEKSVQFIGG